MGSPLARALHPGNSTSFLTNTTKMLLCKAGVSLLSLKSAEVVLNKNVAEKQRQKVRLITVGIYFALI